MRYEWGGGGGPPPQALLTDQGKIHVPVAVLVAEGDTWKVNHRIILDCDVDRALVFKESLGSESNLCDPESNSHQHKHTPQEPANRHIL